MLSHHKLKVYGKGVAVVASLGKHLVQWDKRAACVDIAVIKRFLAPQLCALRAKGRGDQEEDGERCGAG